MSQDSQSKGPKGPRICLAYGGGCPPSEDGCTQWCALAAASSTQPSGYGHTARCHAHWVLFGGVDCYCRAFPDPPSAGLPLAPSANADLVEQDLRENRGHDAHDHGGDDGL